MFNKLNLKPKTKDSLLLMGYCIGFSTPFIIWGSVMTSKVNILMDTIDGHRLGELNAYAVADEAKQEAKHKDDLHRKELELVEVRYKLKLSEQKNESQRQLLDYLMKITKLEQMIEGYKKEISNQNEWIMNKDYRVCASIISHAENFLSNKIHYPKSIISSDDSNLFDSYIRSLYAKCATNIDNGQ